MKVMPRITLRLAIALTAFSVGIAAIVLWLTRREHRVKVPDTPPCQWAASSEHISYDRFPNDIYFPVGTFSPDELFEQHGVKGYSKALTTFGEPSLSNLKDNDIEVYRFLWLRSFHPPVVIRLWRVERERCLNVKQIGQRDLSTNGEYFQRDQITVNRTQPLNEAEWNNFIEYLERASFWTMPTVDGGPVANDGAYWVMEGKRHRAYHVVHRQNPRTGDYRKACVYLIKMSKVEVDESRHELY